MTKHVLRIIALLPLLLAMTVLGSGVSAAQTEPTLTKVVTQIESVDESQPNWARNIKFEYWIDNPSETAFWLQVNWKQPEDWHNVGRYSQASIHDESGTAGIEPQLQVNSIMLRGRNGTTGQVYFTVTVPVPGTWP